MVVLGRKRMADAGAAAEEIEIVGSTGNIYAVTISHLPSCTCPDSAKGNKCKHKVYALSTVLKAPSHLQYQLALLTSELEEIFAHAPPIPTDLADDSRGNRKPTDGECPICYMDLDDEHNKLVWCKAQCGHNLHKSCFDQWAKSQGGMEVRCVYCRTPWETDIRDSEAIKKAGEQDADGYLNVASQFGISRASDYSGYYREFAFSPKDHPVVYRVILFFWSFLFVPFIMVELTEFRRALGTEAVRSGLVIALRPAGKAFSYVG